MKLTKTKDKILQSALDLLESGGIQAVTQLAVAKLVGISQGQLTYHFPKRTDLILALTEIAQNQVSEFIFKQSSNLHSQKDNKITSLIWSSINNPHRIRAMLGLVIEADTNDEIRKKLIDQEEKSRALIAFATGHEVTSPAVTMIHATLLGFGLLTFVKRDDNLFEHFTFAANTFKKSKPKKKSRGPK